MKKFLCKMTIYFTPFLIVIFSFGSIMIYSGELCDIDKIKRYQYESEQDMLVGMAYNEQTAYYKLANANMRNVNVMTLGTSRVMQFKDFFFLNSFYNCGGAVNGNYNEYTNFLNNMDKQALPQFIILGIDSWVFNDAWNYSYSDLKYSLIAKKEPDKIGIFKKIVEDYFIGKWNFRDFINGYGNIGFNGVLKGNGFMNDGSYYYGAEYRNPKSNSDYNFIDTFGRIDMGTARFEYGSEVDEESINYLETLLNYCKENNIMVIGFITPFAPSVVERMYKSGNYEYIWEIAPRVEGIFNKYNYEFYDYTDIVFLGCDDSYFIDGFHGSEVAYGMILQDMCYQDSVLSEVVDLVSLESIMEERYSNLTFFEP